MNTYDVGDLVRVSAEFRDDSDALADPTAVELKFRTPAGVVTTWQVEAGEIVKDATGKYHADINITANGRWAYKFIGTGAVQAVEEAGLFVKKSAIP